MSREVHRRIMYCSIQEAFESNSPVSSVESGAPVQRRQRKHKRTPPPTTVSGFQNPSTPDPDRPANVALPPSDYVGGGSSGATSYSNILSAIDTDQSYFPHPSEDSQIENHYMLEPDWTKQFDGPSVPPWIKERVAAKEAEIPLKPTWLHDGQPTLWQKIPAAFSAPPPTPAPANVTYPDLDDRFQQFESKIDSKLDEMFARLHDLNKVKSESNHIEIILFVIGGLFVLLMLDILVKQGTRASLMLAAAGGGGADLYKRYMSR